MLTSIGAKVLEFNCRLGDPETQVLMPLLETDLVDVIDACVTQNLKNCDLRWKDQTAVCVIMASKGYPEKAQIGDAISGLENIANDVLVLDDAPDNFVQSLRIHFTRAYQQTRRT
jgi:phosphoribosylamine--glycine ligase